MGRMECRYFSGDWLEILVTGPPLLLTISQDRRLNYRLRSHEQVIGKKRLPPTTQAVYGVTLLLDMTMFVGACKKLLYSARTSDLKKHKII
ncbi:MAG: hypothetical protein ACI85J_000535 [Candidatus Poriferisodalaceae bacterium]|jgi:hypothetical protein